MTTVLEADRTRRVARTDGSRYRRFRPRVGLTYQQELRALIRELSSVRPADARVALDDALGHVADRQASLRALGLSAMDLALTVRYEATLRVLRDLLTQGWTIREDDEGVILDAPGRAAVRLDDPEAAKESLRQSFAFAREAQLRERSTNQFIETMERRGIARLFSSGAELAGRLTGEGSAGIKPMLQIIDPGARDVNTGLLLQDVWRYARHFWSIPYQSTPGRNIFYLVRDQALPAQPIIGIAALGNPVLGLAKRDDHYGWSAKGVERRLADLTARRRRALAAHLMAVLHDGIEATYRADFDVGVPDATDHRDAVAQLEQIERQSAALRQPYRTMGQLLTFTESPADRSVERVAEDGRLEAGDGACRPGHRPTGRRRPRPDSRSAVR